MARIGLPVYGEIDKDYKPCGAMHAFAGPLRLESGQPDVALAVQQRKVHRPFSPENARNLVLRFPAIGRQTGLASGKKCFALRIASNICARWRAWMAEAHA